MYFLLFLPENLNNLLRIIVKTQNARYANRKYLVINRTDDLDTCFSIINYEGTKRITTLSNWAFRFSEKNLKNRNNGKFVHGRL